MSKPPKPKKAGRPKLPDSVRRVHFSCTVDPKTKEVLEGLRTPRQSLGQILDDLIVATEGQ